MRAGGEIGVSSAGGEPRTSEAFAAVDTHSSAPKVPAQLQRPPVKSLSVRAHVPNCLYYMCTSIYLFISPAPPSATVPLVPQPYTLHPLDQALEDLTAQEVCAHLKDLNLNRFARAFQEEGLDGADLIEMSEENLRLMLAGTGAIANSQCTCL